MNYLALIPVAIFVVVGGIMNFTFAATLGTDDLTVVCWRALSVGATIFTACGCDLISRAWRANEKSRAVAAATILMLSLTYDVLAAYGFAVKQHDIAAIETAAAQRKWETAKADVDRLAHDLQRYTSAPALAVALQLESSLQSDIAAIDRVPGIIRRGNPCTPPWRGPEREHCPRREALSEKLSSATAQRVQAETRDRIQTDLGAARIRLDGLQKPISADPRADLLGSTLTSWLPVALLTIGALLGVYAVTPPAEPKARTAKPRLASTQAPVNPLETQHMVLTTHDAPQYVVPERPGASRLAIALAHAVAENKLPDGVTCDENGWLRGTQRALANAAGYRHTSDFHKHLHKAAAAGDLDLDTRGRQTAIRLTLAD